MDKSEIIKKVAPCSLMCHTCSAYNDGIICASAKTLLKYLEGIKEFYEVHMPDAVESYNNLGEYLAYMRVLLVQVAAAQNIMDAASKGVFCLSAQRTMALIFVESAMSFRAKKRREFLKK